MTCLTLSHDNGSYPYGNSWSLSLHTIPCHLLTVLWKEKVWSFFYRGGNRGLKVWRNLFEVVDWIGGKSTMSPGLSVASATSGIWILWLYYETSEQCPFSRALCLLGCCLSFRVLVTVLTRRNDIRLPVLLSPGPPRCPKQIQCGPHRQVGPLPVCQPKEDTGSFHPWSLEKCPAHGRYLINTWGQKESRQKKIKKGDIETIQTQVYRFYCHFQCRALCVLVTPRPVVWPMATE